MWLTATSRAGRGRLAGLSGSVSLAPIDSPQATKRFVNGVQPERLFLVETELWPHWLMRARADGIPVAIVSARLSERSVARYRNLGPRMRALVNGLAAVLCQSEDDQRRWLAIGARPERTVVVGNLKSDGLPLPSGDRTAEKRALGLDPARPLLVLGSLRPGEGRHLARAWAAQDPTVRERWQVVAVPRHARASEELTAEVSGAGVTVGDGRVRPGDWRWDDRTGVLVGWYKAADLAFVGGSLSRFGGHNPLEPAACGSAVLMGPHHQSQMDYVRALRAGDAIEIAAAGPELNASLGLLLREDAWRERRAAAALGVARALRGSARRIADQLEAFGLWPA